MIKYIVLILVFVCGCGRDIEAPKVSTKPNKIFGQGRMEGASEEIYLGFLMPGIVKEINANEGDLVKRGDVLIVLDNQEYQDRLSLADATKRMNEAQLTYEKKRHERLAALLLKKSISHEDVEHALMKSLESQAMVDISDAELRVAKDILDKTILRSPIDGMVIDINVHVGEYVGVQPILVVADVSKFCVRVFIEELDALKVKTGMRAEITSDSLDCEFHGIVSKLGHRMTSKEIISNRPSERLDTKVREIWIDLMNPIDDLVVGLLVDVEIELLPSR